MSADAFAVSVGRGTSLSKIKFTEAIRDGAVFGGIEMSLALFGWVLGFSIGEYVSAVDHWIAFVLLSALGAKMIFSGIYGEKNRGGEKTKKNPNLVITAMGSSVDSMGVGASLAFIDVNVLSTVLAIGSTSFVMSAIGTYLGHFIGSRIGKFAEFIGGSLLILIGAKILASHL